MDQELFENARWLVGAIARGLHATRSEAADEVLHRLMTQKLHAADFRPPAPAGLPVRRYLAQTVAETMMLSADIAAAIAAVEDHLCWKQSEPYSDAVLGEGFMANYGWCQLVGPAGFFPGDDFLLGLLLLGPGRHYRDHFHPAPELYWPLTGASLWRQGGGGFAEKPAGTVIWHAANEIHATRTGSAPLLAVWSWTRDVAVSARLVA
jgi:hypothetical protein